MTTGIKIKKLNPIENPTIELVLCDEYNYTMSLEPNYAHHDGISGLDRAKNEYLKDYTFRPFYIKIGKNNEHQSIGLNMEQIEALEQAIKEMKTYIKGNK